MCSWTTNNPTDDEAVEIAALIKCLVDVLGSANNNKDVLFLKIFLVVLFNNESVSVISIDITDFHKKKNFQVGDLRVTFEYAGRSGKESAKLGPPDVVSL